MNKEKAFNFLSLTLFVMIIVLAINVFNSNFYFDFYKLKIAAFFTNTLNFKNIFDMNNTELVSASIDYVKIGDKYISNTNKLYAIEDGVVLQSTNNKIIIFQNNQYYLYYIGEFEPLIKKGDYVEKDANISITYCEFSINISKDGYNYSYEEYIRITI